MFIHPCRHARGVNLLAYTGKDRVLNQLKSRYRAHLCHVRIHTSMPTESIVAADGGEELQGFGDVGRSFPV